MRRNSQGLELLLVGNPNAGKSTLFNALTGGRAKVGNWHGVTVGAVSREATLGKTRCLVTDLPGVYSASPMSMEEKLSVEYVKAHSEAFLLFVCEWSRLPSALPLFYELSRGRRCALVLTKRKQFARAGGKADLAALSRGLSVPALSAEGLRGKKLKEEIGRLTERGSALSSAELPKECYTAPRGDLSRADKILTNGFFCIPFFFGVLLLVFYLTFAPDLPGDRCKSLVEEFFTVFLAGRAAGISSPVLRGFLVDGVFKSVGGVLCFLPQIGMLFFALIVLEESGLFSRLALLADGALSKLGLSGRAIFSILMGFGCTAAAILTTRGLDDKKIQRRVILSLPYISCSAKLPVYLTLASSFFGNPFYAVTLLYALGVGLSLLAALFFKGETPPFVMELAPLQIPRPAFVAKALFFQLKQFIIKLGTVILGFFLASWLLSSFDWRFVYCSVEESMLAGICGGLRFLFAPIGMNDWKIAYAALSGLIAKENVAGALSLFYGGFPYSARSAFAFAVFMLACSPCVSAIAASAKELGWKSALLNATAQTATALLFSYLAYFLLGGGGIRVLLLLAPAVAFAVVKSHEKIPRKRKKFAQKIHG